MDRRCFLRCAAGQLLLVACQSKTSTSVSSPTTGTAQTSSTSLPPPSSTVPVATTSTLPAAEVPGGLVRRIESASSPITLLYDDGIPEEWLSLVSDSLLVSQRGLGDSGPLNYHTYSTPELYVPVYAKAKRRSEDEIRAKLPTTLSEGGIPGNIWQYYPNVKNGPFPRISLLHEYFHTVQTSLIKGPQYLGAAPVWMTEGSADYFSFRLGTDEGLAPPGSAGNFDVVKSRRRTSAVARTGPSLSTYETRGPNNDAYVAGFLAVDYLVANYGESKMIRDLWVATKPPGKDWKGAFSEVFGVSVDQFYADFDAYRRS